MAHYAPKPSRGDRVAIVSPSAGLPELFPRPYELGLERLRDEFGLVPVEYPTTRKMGSAPAERAADLHAAFADPSVTAVICSIGGDDMITVLPHLDPELIRANPKPFFGFSDSTNMHAYLADLGVVAYYGGAVMTAFGRPGAMHPATKASLQAALFTTGPYELTEPGEYRDVDRDWADEATFAAEPPMTPAPGWEWRNTGSVVEGHGWGGCLEVAAWLLMADRCVPEPRWFDGAVLYFETSEEMPPATEVYRVLRSLGERDVLGRCAAFLMGRPKASNLDRPTTDDVAAMYRSEQRDAVLRALDAYAPGVPTVLDVDFGHTDPQLVLPYGGVIRVDAVERRISVVY
jgi:muramoyltetrapeptide carboxypeptidase LdcA involved in peptidoglycan recycling